MNSTHQSLRSTHPKTSPSQFRKTFLDNYLKLGLGSMPKADIDALVMHLLDMEGWDAEKSEPLEGFANLGNQAAAEKLKTTPARIKQLRYAAALKFGGDIERQAKARLLKALGQAVLDVETDTPDKDKVCLIIEDALAKNWLQGQLKKEQQLFDFSFNSEIIKVDSDGLMALLKTCFGAESIKQFEIEYSGLKKEKDARKRKERFRRMIVEFAREIAGGIASGLAAAATGGIFGM